MKFDTPATTNPIDRARIIGRPADRIDGPAKVTGTAPYAFERNDVAPRAAYGWIVGAGIATGRIVRIDKKAAEAARGVIAVVTHENAGKLGKAKAHTARMLAGPEVQHYDQAVAVVLKHQRASISLVQRHLRIGYNRAARLLEQMEKSGMVSTMARSPIL